MSALFAIALLTSPVGSNLRIPVYNFDQKNPAEFDYAETALPIGFKDVKFGSGLISSEDGSISISISRSKAQMPSLLRNSKAKPGDDFTTIRLTNWIGYRNSRKNGEDYKLNWGRHRINLAVDYKDKAKLPKLRSTIHVLVDALNLKSH